MMPILVSIAEAARMIGCGRTTIYRLISDTSLPTCKIGRRTLIPVTALNQLAASSPGS